MKSKRLLPNQRWNLDLGEQGKQAKPITKEHKVLWSKGLLEDNEPKTPVKVIPLKLFYDQTFLET